MSWFVFSKAAMDVVNERRRQVEVEGWTPEHDDEHEPGVLAEAAACYAHAGFLAAYFAHQGSLPEDQRGIDMEDVPPPHRWPPFEGRDESLDLSWPWAKGWWKPGGSRRMLVKAAALLLAEIERLDRADQAKP